MFVHFCFIIISLSVSAHSAYAQEVNPVFWVDAQRKSNNLRNQANDVLSSADKTALGVKANAADRSLRITLDGGFKVAAVSTATVLSKILCEDELAGNQTECECGWRLFSGMCYKYFSGSWTFAAASCPSGRLMTDMVRLKTSRATFRSFYPVNCFWPWLQSTTGECFRVFSTNQETWYDAEDICVNNGARLPVLRRVESWDAFKPLYEETLKCGWGDNEDIWYGLSDYAWPEKTVTTTNYYWGVWTLDGYTNGGNRECVYWDRFNDTWKDGDCSVPRNFVCMKHNPTSRCDPDWIYASPLCYKFLDDTTRTYAEGVTDCAAETATVLSTHSPRQWYYVHRWRMALLNRRQSVFDEIYIGYVTSDADKSDASKYEYADGSDHSWAKWRSGYPSAAGGDCAISAWDSGTNDWDWTNSDCTTPRGIVCIKWPETCPLPGWGDVNEICYKYMDVGKITWAEAERLCHAEEGVLPIFMEDQDSAWSEFQEFRLSQTTDKDEIWIGLTDHETPGTWRWSTLDAYDDSSAFFNDSSNAGSAGIDFVSSKKSLDYAWDISSGTDVMNVICRYKPNACGDVKWWPVSCGKGCTRCYMPMDSIATFAAAEAMCQNDTGKLVPLSSNTQRTPFITWKRLMVSLNYPVAHSWLSYSRGPEENAYWVSNFYGENDLTWWASWKVAGEPDGSLTDGNYYCVSMNNADSELLRDEDCTNVRGVLCLKDVNAYCPEGWGETKSGNNYFCYKVMDSAVENFADAQAACAAEGANLPSFHSWGEYLMFLRYRWVQRDTGSTSVGTVWIGLTDSVTELDWVWTDSSNYNWNYWTNGTQPVLDTSKDCAYSTDDGGYMQWQQRACTDTLNFICQMRKIAYGDACGTSPAGFSQVGVDCYKPITHITDVDRTEASAFCDYWGWSLPGINTTAQWTAFQNWMINMNRMKVRFSTDATAGWPVNDIWMGLYDGTRDNLGWWYQDGSHYDVSISAWSGSNPDNVNHRCVKGDSSLSWAWDDIDCQTKVPTLVCEKTPRLKGCPSSSWIQYPQEICYMELSGGAQQFSAAKTQCEAAGGHLPSFHSQDEWDDYLRNTKVIETADAVSFATLWLGLNDIAVELEWLYTDGTNFNWNRWKPAVEPDSDTGKNCVVAYLDGADWYWKGEDCNQNHRVFCQARNNPPSNPCESGWALANGLCYRIFPEVTNVEMTNAQAFCSKKHGQLPVFHSVSEWEGFKDWRDNIENAKGLSTTNFWIGCMDPGSGWAETVDGSPYDYSDWDGLEPDGTGDCAISNSALGFQWEDQLCASTATNILCQYRTVQFCTSDWTLYDDEICYKLLGAGAKDYTAAEADCTGAGGFLPSFHSSEEFNDYITHKWVLDTIGSPGSPFSSFWIGLSDAATELVWEWSDGTNFNWNQWKPSIEPASDTPADDCVVAYLDGSSWFWRDEPCSATHQFICQTRNSLPPNGCSTGWAQANGLCYRIYLDVTSVEMTNAQAFCSKKHGQLPVFHSASEWEGFKDWRDNIENAKDLSTTNFWIGYNDPGSGWAETVDGTPYDFWDWNIVEPDGTGQCAISNSALGFEWEDRLCASTAADVICQYRTVQFCAGDWTLYDGEICYKHLAAGPKDYSAADADCTGVGGFLPSFHSSEEFSDFVTHKWVLEAIGSTGSPFTSFWVGLTDANTELAWEWLDGTNFNWNQWKPTIEPASDTSADDCVVAYLDGANWFWKDEPCSATHEFICQTRNSLPPDICTLGWAEAGQKCYKVFPEVTNIVKRNAAAYCRYKGGWLPIFHSQNEWDEFLLWKANINQAKDLATTVMWIGLTGPPDVGVWGQWDDLSLYDFSAAWDTVAGEPSGSGPCAATQPSNYLWGDESCSSTMANLICQEGNLTQFCPLDWTLYDGDVCYKQTSTVAKQFSTSKSECESEGGYLPSFHSLTEWEEFLLHKWVLETSDSTTISSFWVGLNDITTELVWEWVDTTNYNWNQWKTGTQPELDNARDCVIGFLDGSDWVWQIEDCTASHKFVCQMRDTIPSDPCTPGYSEVESKCFKVFPEATAVGREYARAYCRYYRNYLPSFSAQVEWDEFLLWKSNIGRAKDLDTTDIWLGLLGPPEVGTWGTWDDGAAYSYTTAWGGSEPSGSGGCVAAKATGYAWADESCTDTMNNIICEEGAVISQFCPVDWSLYSNDICYKQTTIIPKTFDNAVTECTTAGGELASIHSQADWDDLLLHRWVLETARGTPITEFWIGLNDKTMEQRWDWVDGSNFNWNQWKPSVQPESSATKDCVLAYLDGTDGWVWKEEDCSASHEVICQMRQTVTPDSCTAGWADAGGQCYKVYPEAAAVGRETARAYCRYHGTYLPIFHTQAEWDEFLLWKTNMNRAKSLDTSGIWLGLLGPPDLASWGTWDDATSLVFTAAWGGSEPSGTGACVASRPATSYSWDDNSCTSTAANVICQEGTLVQFCPADWTLYKNSVCYKHLAVGVKTFDNAHADCVAAGGSLPSFHSRQDFDDFLMHKWVLETSSAATYSSFWIGLHDRNTELGWEWIDTSNYNWNQWKAGVEPSQSTAAHDCAAAYLDGGSWVWKDQDCSATHEFLCQLRQTVPPNTCGLGWSLVDGECFKIFPEATSVNREHGRAYCRHKNSYLPSFHSTTEWDEYILWKANFGQAKDHATLDFWLGLFGPPEIASWGTWDDSSPYDWSTWNPASPSGAGACATGRSVNSYLWTDETCTNTVNSVLCKAGTLSQFCPSGWDLYAGGLVNICYKRASGGTMDFSSATTACNGLSSKIPSFHSQKEWEDFLTQIWVVERSDAVTITSLWIGLTDATTELEWEWADTTNYNWNQWKSTVQPVEDTNKNCVVAELSGTDWIWRVEDCSATHELFCQKRETIATSMCNPGWAEVENYCYQIRPEATDLQKDNAKAYCQAYGGTLPEFHSQPEYDAFILWKMNAARAKDYSTDSFWIGLNGPPNAAAWGEWDEGSAYDWSNWDTPTEPSGNGGCTKGNSASSYKWDDHPCTGTVPSTICQSKALTSWCPTGWRAMNDICYTPANVSAVFDLLSVNDTWPNITDGLLSFNLSSRLCGFEGGALPSFHTVAEWESFLVYRWLEAALLDPSNPVQLPVWLGLNDIEQELLWIWSDDTNFNWNWWDKNATIQPVEDTSLNCVYSPSPTTGTDWRVTDCHQTHHVICQIRKNTTDLCGVEGWSRVGNRCYQIFPEYSGLNYVDAAEECRLKDGTLVSFETSAQWDAFLAWKENTGRAKQLKTEDFWLGMEWVGSWSWSDEDTTFSWTKWGAGGDPNNGSFCIKSSNSTHDYDWIGTHCYSDPPKNLIYCILSNWTNSSCSASCGMNVTYERSRYVIQRALNGGQACGTPLLEIHECLDSGICPIHCEQSEWFAWGACDCKASDDGMWTRSRETLVFPEYNGTKCGPETETAQCAEGQCHPMTKAERIAGNILQSLGCIWLIACCALSFTSTAAFRIFTMERLIHGGQEVALIVAHLFVLTVRERTDIHTVCIVSSVTIQFCTLVNSIFMVLEALQLYAYVTNVISNGNYFSWHINLAIPLVSSFVVTGSLAAVFYDDYPSQHSCWLNFGETHAMSTVMPVLLTAVLTAIIIEAAGMRDLPRLPDTDVKKYLTNKVNQRGLLFVLPLNFCVWFVGAFTIYYQNIGLYTLVFVFNVSLGSAIFAFHALSHGAVRAFFSRCFQKFRNAVLPKSLQGRRGPYGPTPNTDLSDISNSHSTNILDPNIDADGTAENSAPTTDTMAGWTEFARWISDGQMGNLSQAENVMFGNISETPAADGSPPEVNTLQAVHET